MQLLTNMFISAKSSPLFYIFVSIFYVYFFLFKIPSYMQASYSKLYVLQKAKQ